MADAKLVKPEKLPDTNFQQQNLKAWQPLLTPRWVIIFFIVIGLILVPLGIIVLAITLPVVHTEVRYDNLPRNAGNITQVTINIPDDMSPPIFFYYKLTDYYQNHRLYVKSRDSNQLKGAAVSASDLDTKCAPLSRENGETGKLLYPCGLIAQSIFTDTYSDPVVIDGSVNGTQADWTSKGISWESDREKFLPFTDYNDATMTNISVFSGSPVDHTTEDFMVWMRTSGLPTFMKLRYIINTGLKQGQTFQFDVKNIYDVASFGGEKGVVLSTMSSLGGKNPFLGYFAIIAGCVSFALAGGAAILTMIKPRKLGDMSYFNGHLD